MTDAAERGYRSCPRGVRTRRAAIQRWILSAAALAPLMFGMGLLGPGVTEQILATSMEQVPAFELDPLWPRIPAEWKLGDVSSVAVDAHDHVWVLHRPRTLAPEDERMAAPPVLEFDPAGNVVRAWGGPADGLEWPEREHGIHVDDERNVWIGGNNCVGRSLPGLKNVSDDQLLKLTETGRLVMQIGRSNSSRGNSDTMNLSQPSDVFVYAKTHEVFVADGYANHRVIVFDAETGAFKRMWGAFGNTPVDDQRCPPPSPAVVPDDGSPGPAQFGIVHAVRVSNDGFVYVADREHKRVQVFTIEGTFVSQVFIGRSTPDVSRTASSLDFSADAEQQFLYIAGTRRIVVLNRHTLEMIGSIETGAHHIAVDSRGNIYTASPGPSRRPRKLVFKGSEPGR